MKLLKAEVTNFGSYESLSFDFKDQGLALVHGATGSGKSTLQDIPCWILFGVTAKDGSVDDVKSWTSGNPLPTSGKLTLEAKDGDFLRVTRIRGKPSQNDLYWEDYSGLVHRGKDITETQALLNIRLGIDPYVYIMASYYNEFSPTGSFFTAKASDRRQLFENLANLELPIKLLERISFEKKEGRKAIISVTSQLDKSTGIFEQLQRTKINSERDAQLWSEAQKRILEELEIKSEKFTEEKEYKIQVAELKAERYEVFRQSNIERYTKDLDRKISRFKEDKVCQSCGDIREKDALELLEIQDDFSSLIDREKSLPNPFLNEKDSAVLQQNPYKERIDFEKSKLNPWSTNVINLDNQIAKTMAQNNDLKSTLDELNHRLSGLTRLQDLTSVLRASLLKNVINEIQMETNRYLETHFDSELRVQFNLDESDNLEIMIFKNAYECVYRQLSKGQRGLLKLCFSVATMKMAANRVGVHFNSLLFDEALDGMDSMLKTKAFNLFEELSKFHETVLVIEHSNELQNLFDKQYHVTLKEDTSHIEVSHA